jgi:nitrile hydratase subunit beta
MNSTSLRYTHGQSVKILDRHASGHCRTPTYILGAVGVIDSMLGSFRNPEKLAYGHSGLPPCTLYWVRFALTDLFEQYDGMPSDTLLVEVYEHWLAPARQEDHSNE